MMQKIVQPTIDLISSFVDAKNISLSIDSSGIVNEKASFCTEKNQIVYHSEKPLTIGEISNLKIELNNQIFNTDNVTSVTTKEKDSRGFPHTISFSDLTQDGFPLQEKSFFRIVLPVTGSLNFFPLLSFAKSYQIEYKEFSRGLIQVKVKSDFDVFIMDEFLFIDCHDTIAFEDFYDQVYILLTVIGFLTGNFIQEKCYIFSYSDSKFDKPLSLSYSKLAASIQHQKLLSESSCTISSNVFNELTKFCHEHPEVLNSLTIIIHSSLYTLETRPACLAVALEGVCSALEPKKMSQGKSQPHPHKELKTQLETTAETYFKSKGKSKKERDEWKSKIGNLFQQSNQKKLNSPFKQLNTKLKNYEKKAIKNRNFLLHSNLKYTLRERAMEIPSDLESQKIYFSCLVLTKLLYKLLLAHCGYCGKIRNIPKIQEKFFENLLKHQEIDLTQETDLESVP